MAKSEGVISPSGFTSSTPALLIRMSIFEVLVWFLSQDLAVEMIRAGESGLERSPIMSKSRGLCSRAEIRSERSRLPPERCVIIIYDLSATLNSLLKYWKRLREMD